MRYIGSGSLLSIIYYFLKFLEWYDISLIHPHTQGIIEISLKPPKNPYIIQKKRISPIRTQNQSPHNKKRNYQGFVPNNFFFIVITAHLLPAYNDPYSRQLTLGPLLHLLIQERLM